MWVAIVSWERKEKKKSSNHIETDLCMIAEKFKRRDNFKKYKVPEEIKKNLR